MHLKLTRADLREEHRDTKRQLVGFDMFTAEAQAAIQLIGSAEFYDLTTQCSEMVYPPRQRTTAPETAKRQKNDYDEWLKEEVENRGAEWILHAIFHQRDAEVMLRELAKSIRKAEPQLTALGIEYPRGGDLLYPVATAAVEKLASIVTKPQN